MIRYADICAFVFPQTNLVAKPDGLVLDPNIVLDLCVATSVPPFCRTMDSIVAEHNWFATTLSSQTGVNLVQRRADLELPGLKVVFGLQHPPEDAMTEDLLRVRHLGVLFTSLAYLGTNRFGGGFAEPEKPLSEAGKAFLESITETGFVLDVSHVGHTTAREALEYRNKRGLTLRVVATHSGCYGVYNHPRNLPDDILEQLDLVGIPTTTWMLHERDNTLIPFRRHLEHALDLMGTDAVAIGSDGIYKQLSDQEWQEWFAMMDQAVGNLVFKSRLPDQPLGLNTPRRMDVLQKKLHWLQPSTQEKILGENAFRFLSKVLPY